MAYDATLSGSLLSDMFIHSLSSRSFWPRIHQRYDTAIDVQSRVETGSMSDMLRQLAGLERISRALGRIVDNDLLNADTSTVAFIHNAIDCIVNRTQDSIGQFNAHLLQPYTEAYQSNVEFFVHRIVNSANAFLAFYASSKQPFSDGDVSANARTFCEQFSKFKDWFENDFESKFRARTYSSRKSCDGDRFSLWCGEFLKSGGELVNVHSETGCWLKCMTEFKDFLDEVNSWVKTQETLHSDLLLQAASDDVTRVHAKLRNNTNSFARMTESFRLHEITKV